jgi:hypothetical protein
VSLINRMLDDLAARQAPGAESLQGVRLSEPLESANDGLDQRKAVALLLVVFAVAGSAWWLWPDRAPAPPPQVRAEPKIDTAAVKEPELAPSAHGGAPRLQLASRLTSLEAAADAPAIDDAQRAEGLQAPAPLPVPRAPPRSTTAVPSDASRVSLPAEPRPAISEPAPRASFTPAPVTPPRDPLQDNKQRARVALAGQDPANALAALPPSDAARDVESAALRAAALQQLGRHAEAADAYAALTTREPAEPGHWVGLGISLEGEQRRDPARMAYRRALQSDRLAPSLRAFAQDRVTVLEAP